jgi:tetratricopeptide (TPR) repeat protein
MLRRTILAFTVVLMTTGWPGWDDLQAQVPVQEQAQAYYFEAESELADGRLDRAEDYHQRALELLGGDNAKLSALDVKILFARKDYEAARAALDRFYSFDPGPNLKRDMAPLLVQIDELLERQRLAARREEEARLLAETTARERLERLRDAVSTCVDRQTCLASQDMVSAQGGEGLNEYFEPIKHRLCWDFSEPTACNALAIREGRVQGEGSEEDFAAAEHSCALGNREGCRFAALFLIPDRNGLQRVNSIKTDPVRTVEYLSRSCELSDYLGCNLLVFLYWSDEFGVQRNSSEYKRWARPTCVLSQAEGYYFSGAMQQRCEKWDFPKLRVGK